MGTPARGFRYRRVDGRKVTSQDLARIRALRIPPAWIEVAINSAASGRVQVVGKDAAAAGNTSITTVPSANANKKVHSFNKIWREPAGDAARRESRPEQTGFAA